MGCKVCKQSNTCAIMIGLTTWHPLISSIHIAVEQICQVECSDGFWIWVGRPPMYPMLGPWEWGVWFTHHLSTFINSVRGWSEKGYPKSIVIFPLKNSVWGIPCTPIFQKNNLVSIWTFPLKALLFSWAQRSSKCWNNTNLANSASTLLSW